MRRKRELAVLRLIPIEAVASFIPSLYQVPIQLTYDQNLHRNSIIICACFHGDVSVGLCLYILNSATNRVHLHYHGDWMRTMW